MLMLAPTAGEPCTKAKSEPVLRRVMTLPAVRVSIACPVYDSLVTCWNRTTVEVSGTPLTVSVMFEFEPLTLLTFAV